MGMPLLIGGLALFFAPHLLRELGLRDAVAARLGSEGAFKGAYSLVAILGIVLAVWGKGASDFIMIWEPPYEQRWISHLLMLPALLLIVAGNLPMSHLRQQLRNPMVAGVVIWGVAHLWSNGDLASMLLFGGFALWGSLKFLSLSKLEPGTATASVIWDVAAVIATVILYFTLAVFHGQLFGVGLNFAQ